jgi:hypothetical protein
MRKPKHGKGQLRVGNPGHKGAGGRPPDEFRAMMAELASRPQRIKTLNKILADAKHPHFMAALKHVTEHGYGKPKESVDHTSGGKPIAGINWNVVRPEPGTEPHSLDAILAQGKNGNGSG